MGRLQSDLWAFYERQASSLLTLALHCTDMKTQQKLAEMASEYIDKLDIVAAEKLIERPRPVSH